MVKTTKILYQQLNNYTNPAAKISRMVKGKEIIPIINGLYETEPSTPGHYLAGIIYGPSYLSFEFALSLHNLIPEAVYVFTSATCNKKRKKQYVTPFGVFSYRDVPVAVFPYGIKLIEENEYSYIIASPEKAVCDLLYTCSPCANRKELKELLFEDHRIDEYAFRNLDYKEMTELACLYKTTNHRLLTSMLKEMERHE